MRISDWSSDVCSSDLVVVHLFDTIIHKLLHQGVLRKGLRRRHIDQARVIALIEMAVLRIHHSCLSIAHEVLAKVLVECVAVALELRSEEHTSELQSLMRISYAVFCLKKKQNSAYTENPKPRSSKDTVRYINKKTY